MFFFGAIYESDKDDEFYLLVGNEKKKVSENTFFYIKFSDREILGKCHLSDNAIQELNNWIDLKKDLLIRLELCELDDEVYLEKDFIIEQIEK